MDEQRFDAALRALQAGTTRRRGLAAALGLILGGVGLDASAKGKDRDKPGTEGPCGNGSRKANICKKNSDCCTGVCNTKLGKKNRDKTGRCRCIQQGKTCKTDKNCCGDMTCSNGVCGKGGPACDATTCPDGCCANGVCETSGNHSCGTGGVACVDCVADGKFCDAGICVVQCNVCASGCDYTTIADAIDGTADGGTILIAPGTYTEGKMFILKSLTIAGCDPTDPPVIDSGTDTYGVFTTSWNNETLTWTLSDVELTAPSGNAVVLNPGTTATIERVRIYGSKRGIDSSDASLTMKDCVIEDNDSDRNGGGLRLYSSGTATTVIEDTLIRNNSSNNTGYDSYGGGGIASYTGLVTLKGTTSITGNTAAANGGGVLLTGGSFTMESTVTITGNSADCYGGLYNEPSSGGYAALGGVSVSTVIGNTATGSCGCNNLSGGGSCNS
jgi:hypothetical protein